MRTITFVQLIAALLLATVPVGTAGVAGTLPVAVADDDKGQDEDDSDGNRGHGNDDDGVDEDNPGQGKKDDEGEKSGGKEKVKPEATGGYAVEVDCIFDAEADRSECTFTGVPPEGGKDIGFLQVPSATLCAEVLTTGAELADPHPNTHVTGYVLDSKDGSLRLTFAGPVTTGGTSEYWIKAGNAVAPASGPGLDCGTPAPETGAATTQQATFAAAPDEATGTIRVVARSCEQVPADTTGFDWFAGCAAGMAGRSVEVAPAGTANGIAAETDGAGEVVFSGLEPGTYDLTLLDGSWCHAKSDRVTAESDVVVEAGQESTVWVFLCDQGGGV